MECVNKFCQKKPCPYGCCSDELYQRKDCPEGYQCMNNACEKIPKPAIGLTIDECETSMNVLQGLGEVTNVYITVENYGDKAATNVKISATANDVGQQISNASGTISAISIGATKKIKLTVDTENNIPTTATVTVTCPECETATQTEPDCHYNLKNIIETVQEYVSISDLVGMVI
ncbi:MAG: hypothetical protein Q8N60_04185 [Candidatus Diapherotrites archaeon]|nr:hypothetical protein [Candidatus Diapherotrites archaeon]